MMTTFQLSGEHIEATNPPQYKALWTVTQVKGRWNITVQQPHRSNTAVFKINKREQIVAVANSWKGANQQVGHSGPMCDDLVIHIYGQVGFTLSGGGNNVEALYNSTDTTTPDTGSGSIVFYHWPTDTDANWRHTGVSSGGGQIIDQNCPHAHSTYPTYTDGFGNLQIDTEHPPSVGQHSEIDSALVNPAKYAAPVHYTIEGLLELDNE